MSLTRLVELLVETPDWIMSFNTQEYAMIVLQRMKERFLQIDDLTVCPASLSIATSILSRQID
jgi:hypothetical protein